MSTCEKIRLVYRSFYCATPSSDLSLSISDSFSKEIIYDTVAWIRSDLLSSCQRL